MHSNPFAMRKRDNPTKAHRKRCKRRVNEVKKLPYFFPTASQIHTCAHLLLVDVKRRARRCNLQDGRPEHDGRIHQRPSNIAAGHKCIDLPHRRLRYHRGDGVALGGRSHARGVEAAHKRHKEASRQGPRDREGKWDSLRGGKALRGRQRGEGLDGEGGVAGRAGFNEGGGEGVDGVEAEGGAVGVRGVDLAEVEALQRGVQGFGYEDGACNAEIGLVGDEGSATEIGGGANTTGKGLAMVDGRGEEVIGTLQGYWRG